MKRTAVIAGGTGLVGSALLPLVCEASEYARVLGPTRRPLPYRHAKLQERPADFEHLDQALGVSLASASKGGTAHVDVFCCLGTTIARAGSPAAFRAVDHDLVVALGQWAAKAAARRFLVVSALGADADSRVFYNRVKGETENDLRALGLRSLVLLRPSLLDGDRSEARFRERLALAAARPIRALIPRPWRPVQARDVAASLLLAARDENSPSIVDSGQMHGAYSRVASTPD